MARTFERNVSRGVSASLAHGIGTGDFTFACWIYPTSDGAGDRTVWSNGLLNPAMFQKEGGGGQFSYYNLAGGVVRFTTSLAANARYHLAVRRSGTTVTGWLNGAVDANTGTDSGSIGSGEQCFGTDVPASASDGYDGDISHGCLWNVALSADELLALARGVDPIRIRPTAIVGGPWYLDGVFSPEPAAGANGADLALTGSPVKAATNAPVELWPLPLSFGDVAAGGATQDIQPDSIAAGSSLGSPTVTVGTATIVPTSIAAGSALGNPVITTGAVSVTPTSISSGSTLGEPSISAVVAPDSITATSSLGAPTITTGSVSVAPTSIAAGSSLGEPTVALLALTITPTSIGPVSSLGEPTIYGGILVLDNRSRYYALAYIMRIT